MHHTPLIALFVAGFVLAFFLGALARRLRLSPLVGYLLAGVAIGPATPGFIGGQRRASGLAAGGAANVFEAGQVIAKARRANSGIQICARAETEGEVEHLRSHGADEVIVGRREIALGMIEHAFGQPPAALAG